MTDVGSVVCGGLFAVLPPPESGPWSGKPWSYMDKTLRREGDYIVVYSCVFYSDRPSTDDDLREEIGRIHSPVY